MQQRRDQRSRHIKKMQRQYALLILAAATSAFTRPAAPRAALALRAEETATVVAGAHISATRASKRVEARSDASQSRRSEPRHIR